MTRTLIIGYGNPLREDDGVGWRVVEEIDQGQWTHAHCQLDTLAVHQLLPELAGPVSAAELVIFVDAAVEGEPGRVLAREITPESLEMGAFTHHFDPVRMLAYARDLYGRFPRAYLVTITAVNLGYGEDLSPLIEARLPEVLKQIAQLIG